MALRGALMNALRCPKVQVAAVQKLAQGGWGVKKRGCKYEIGIMYS